VREAVLAQTQKALLKRFAEIGGCVDYLLLDCDPAAGDDVTSGETHRRAAILALEIIRQRVAAYAAATSQQQGIPIQKFFSLTIDHRRAASLVGTRISREEFLGPRYDAGQDSLVIPSGGPIPGGYAYAFSDPPYSLYDYGDRRRVSEAEATELFHAINQEVLGGITAEPIIFQWPDAWSNYFEKGKEWWGSFLWTFANPGAGRIVVLAASTTD